MLRSVGVDDPQLRVPLVLELVHVLARVDDARAVRRDLRVADPLPVELVLRRQQRRRSRFLRDQADASAGRHRRPALRRRRGASLAHPPATSASPPVLVEALHRGAAVRHPQQRRPILRRRFLARGPARSAGSPYSSNDGLIGSGGPDGASSVSSIDGRFLQQPLGRRPCSSARDAIAGADFLLHDRERLRAIRVRSRLRLRAHRLQLVERDVRRRQIAELARRSGRRRARTPRCRRSRARRRPSPRRSAAPASPSARSRRPGAPSSPRSRRGCSPRCPCRRPPWPDRRTSAPRRTCLPADTRTAATTACGSPRGRAAGSSPSARSIAAL